MVQKLYNDFQKTNIRTRHKKVIKSFKDINNIYCINLEKRVDRKEECLNLFKSLGISKYSFIEAKDGLGMFPDKPKQKAARMGCSLSHIDTIQKFKTTQNKYALILEDDFICDNNMIEKFDKYISQVPEEFCMLYLGSNHKKLPLYYSKNVVQCVKSYSSHAYIINNLYINKILEGKYMNYQAIDVYFSDFIHQTYSCYCFDPKLIWQRKSYSDIENKVVFYKMLTEDKKL